MKRIIAGIVAPLAVLAIVGASQAAAANYQAPASQSSGACYDTVTETHTKFNLKEKMVKGLWDGDTFTGQTNDSYPGGYGWKTVDNTYFAPDAWPTEDSPTYTKGDFIHNSGGTWYWTIIQQWDNSGGTKTVEKQVEVPCEVPTNVCDPKEKPGGMSIAKWLESEGYEASDCFGVSVVPQCGSVDVSVSSAVLGIPFRAQWAEGAGATPVYPGKEFPATFPEDYNGGSVDITYWLIGGESDYLKGYALPNLWDGTGVTVTVDTDCQDSESEPQTRWVEDKTTDCTGYVSVTRTEEALIDDEWVATGNVEKEAWYDDSLITCVRGENG